MEKSNLKNIVVLKNLPSNIVDEAIVILKPNNKIKKVEVLGKNKNIKSVKKSFESNKHILKEAEMLITSYISKIEKKNKITEEKNKLKQKYNIIKKYAIVISVMLVISLVINFI